MTGTTDGESKKGGGGLLDVTVATRTDPRASAPLWAKVGAA